MGLRVSSGHLSDKGLSGCEKTSDGCAVELLVTRLVNDAEPLQLNG